MKKTIKEKELIETLQESILQLRGELDRIKENFNQKGPQQEAFLNEEAPFKKVSLESEVYSFYGRLNDTLDADERFSSIISVVLKENNLMFQGMDEFSHKETPKTLILFLVPISKDTVSTHNQNSMQPVTLTKKETFFTPVIIDHFSGTPKEEEIYRSKCRNLETRSGINYFFAKTPMDARDAILEVMR